MVKIGPEKIDVGWPWRLLLFSILVLATAAAVYLGLEFGYKIYLDNQIKKEDKSITDLSASISKEEQEKFIDFYSQLANLKVLLDKHIFVSKLMPFLESNTNRLVYYDHVGFSVKDSRLDLDGIAASYESLSQQLEAFSRAPETDRVSVGESQRNGNQVKFRLSLFLKRF